MKPLTIVIVVALLAVLVVAIVVRVGRNGGEDSQDDTRGALVFPNENWAGTYLPYYVLKAIFEDELGYSVRIGEPGKLADAYAAVGRGEADIFHDGWFPGTRDATLERDPNLVKLGFVFGGKARDAVSSVMISADFARENNITHIRDLKDPDIARALDTDGDGKGNLIGAPADWDGAKRVPEILSQYGLAELYEVDATSSEADLVAKVDQRLRQGGPALFYMIRPVAFPGGLRLSDHARFWRAPRSCLPSLSSGTSYGATSSPIILRLPRF